MAMIISILDNDGEPVDDHHIGDNDEQLLLEALYCLREKKEEAYRVLTGRMSQDSVRCFTEKDFAIPQINNLIKIVEGE